jgi:DNA-directed RNA polymerase subunit beta'
VGRLIPAGTGASIATSKIIASKRDDLILDERRRQSETIGIAAPTQSAFKVEAETATPAE